MTASTPPKSKRRLLRRFLIGGGVFVGLLVLLVVLAAAFVPAEKIKTIAFEQLEANTGLRGSATDASVSVFPLGAKLEGLRIDDPAGAVPSLEDMQLELESAIVSADLMSILRGAPEVSEVRLVRPRIELVLAATETSAGSGASSGESPEVAAALGLVSIVDGYVKITQPTGQVIELDDLDNDASLTLADGSATGTIRGSLGRLTLRGGEMPRPIEVPALEWALDVDAQIDGKGGQIVIDRLETAGVRATGTAAWTGDAPELDVDLDLEGDVATAWTALGRGFVDPATLPPGIGLDDFDLVAGRVVADVVYRGAVPAADPNDPTAALRPLRVEGRLEGARARIFDRDDLLALDGGFTVDHATIRLSDLSLSGDVLEATGGIVLPTAMNGNATGSINARLDALKARALAEAWWPRLEAMATPADGAAPAGPDTWPQVEGMVQADLDLDLPVDGSFDPNTGAADAVAWRATNTAPVRVQLPTFTEAFEADGLRATGDLKSAQITDGRVTGPGVDATARLTLGGWPETIVVRGTADATSLDLDALQEALVKPETAWIDPSWLDDALGVAVAHAQDDADEIAPPPANLDVDVQLTAKQVQSSGYTLRDVQARTLLKQQKLDVQDVTAQLGDGTITGTAAVDWTVETPAWTSDLQADAIPASSLLEPFAGPLAQALTTSFTGAIDLDGPLRAAPEEILTALTGLANLRADDGSIAAEQLLGPKISQFLGENAEQWKRLTFDALKAHLEVREGKVFFDDLTLRGDTEVDVGGWMGLDGVSNVRLDVRLPAGVTPNLGALQPVADFLQDDAGRITFGVNVTGQGAKPQVEIDLAELQERATDRGRDAAEDAAKDALDDLIDRNREGIDDALGGLLGGAKDDSTANDDSDSGLGGLLDRLRGKKGGGGN